MRDYDLEQLNNLLAETLDTNQTNFCIVTNPNAKIYQKDVYKYVYNFYNEEEMSFWFPGLCSFTLVSSNIIDIVPELSKKDEHIYKFILRLGDKEDDSF